MVSGLKSKDYEERLKELGMSNLSQGRKEMELQECTKL
jgi:3-deoxy-D-manno-octulosonate 8-phosphate phosphatase KdsC-like HAD superfamily phosphatase